MVFQLTTRIFAFGLLAVSCRKAPVAMAENQADPKATEKVDTFSITENRVVDRIFIRHRGDDLAPDSTGVSNFTIEFVKNTDVVRAFKFSLPYQRETAFWNVSNEVFTDSAAHVVDRRFFIASNGFEACGYPQYSLLFYAGPEIELIDRWVSVSDSGLGTWREFFPVFESGRVGEFRLRMVSSEAVDGPDGETLIEMSYRDSVVMRQAGSRWLREAVTLPDVRYRTEVLHENDYYQ